MRISKIEPLMMKEYPRNLWVGTGSHRRMYCWNGRNVNDSYTQPSEEPGLGVELGSEVFERKDLSKARDLSLEIDLNDCTFLSSIILLTFS